MGNKITMGRRVNGYWWNYINYEVHNLLLDWEQRQICGCNYDTLTKQASCRITICDLPWFGVKNGGEIHCQRLNPFEKHTIVSPMGSKFCHTTNQQMFGKGESDDSSIQVPISYFFSWPLYVGIWDNVWLVCHLEWHTPNSLRDSNVNPKLKTSEE
jgi:hypothetical protein